MTNNLSKEMKISNIEEPEFEKWNELPPDMKLETIKKINFETRCNLRSTCRLEKSLVDSQKFHIDKVVFVSEFMGQRTRYEHGSQRKSNCYGSIDDMIPPLQYIMEHAIIKELLVEFSKEELLITDKLRPLPWTVKCAKLQCKKQNDLKFCLERLNEKTEKIKIDASWADEFSFDSILIIPQIIKVPFLEINKMKQPDLQNVYKLAQIWIKNDASIGQRFDIDRFVFGEYKDFNEFKNEFSTRIVQMETVDGKRLDTGNRQKNAQNLRIRSDDLSKHILIQLGDLDETKNDGKMVHMTVIPADMKETEYDMKWFEDFKGNFGVGGIDIRQFLDAINNVNLDDLDHLFGDIDGVEGDDDLAEAYEDYYDDW